MRRARIGLLTIKQLEAPGLPPGGYLLEFSGGPFGVQYTLSAGATPPLAADFNSDGDVDGGDFLAWQRGYGTQTPNAVKSDGDADDDLDVDGNDLAFWGSQFGTSSALVVEAAYAASESVLAIFQESVPVGIKAEPLSAELVDAAIAMEQTLRSNSESRFRLSEPSGEDHFDWLPRRARWGQPPAWQGISEIANNSLRSKINDGRLYRDPDAVDEDSLDKLFADGGVDEAAVVARRGPGRDGFTSRRSV
jgi:hypothetical protein